MVRPADGNSWALMRLLDAGEHNSWVTDYRRLLGQLIAMGVQCAAPVRNHQARIGTLMPRLYADDRALRVVMRTPQTTSPSAGFAADRLLIHLPCNEIIPIHTASICVGCAVLSSSHPGNAPAGHHRLCVCSAARSAACCDAPLSAHQVAHAAVHILGMPHTCITACC